MVSYNEWIEIASSAAESGDFESQQAVVSSAARYWNENQGTVESLSREEAREEAQRAISSRFGGL